MQFQSDYIMRMIESLRKLFAALFELTDEQKNKQGEKLLADAMRRLAGIDMSLCMAVPANELFQLVGGSAAPDRALAAARILCMKADLIEDELEPLEAQSIRRTALSLYLDIGPEGDGFVSENVRLLLLKGVEADGMALAKFFELDGDFARAEDELDKAWHQGVCGPDALRAFYERMAGLSSERLAKGGLPRSEVIEGMARLP